jgi:hypothetical protein
MLRRKNSPERPDLNVRPEEEVPSSASDEARAPSESGSTDGPSSPEVAPKIDCDVAIISAKQRLHRERKMGPDRPLYRLARTEAELKEREQTLAVLSAPKPVKIGSDLLHYQLQRGINRTGVCKTHAAKILRDTLSLYVSLDSRDPVESLLNRHMVTMSNGAMECHYRSVFACNNPKSFDVYARHAEKMTRTLIELTEALERHRRPKQVVIGNVNIKAGGQAIVGTVETRKSGSRDDEDPGDDSAAA